MECKVIHQIWFQGESQLPDKYRDNMNRVREVNPRWEHRVWDDIKMREACRQCGWGKAYDACRHMHQKIDFGRYVVLYLFGGISIDADVSPIQPLDTLWDKISLTNDRVIVSKLPLHGVEASLMSLRNVPWFLNNATIICPRPRMSGQRLLCEHMADRLVNPPRVIYALGTPMMQINWTTGPCFFTTIFLDHMDREQYELLPASYFEPCVGHDHQCSVDKNVSILNHHHDSTWHSSSMFIESYYFLKHRVGDLLLLVACISAIVAIR